MTGGDKVKLKAAGFRVFYQNRDKKKIYESVYGTVRTYAELWGGTPSHTNDRLVTFRRERWNHHSGK